LDRFEGIMELIEEEMELQERDLEWIELVYWELWW